MKTIICVLLVAFMVNPGCRARRNRAADSGSSTGQSPSSAQDTKPPPPSASPAYSMPGEWMLKTLNGNAISAGKAPWIRIEVGGALRGWAGVNQISSQLDQSALARSEFKVSPIIATRMAGPPESMKLESDFLTALQNARTYSASDQSLSLHNESGGLIASFARKTGS